MHVSHSVTCLSLSWACTLENKRFYFWWNSVYFFPLVAFALGVISKNLLANPRSQRFLSIFSSKSCIVLVLTFRSLIHFELILVFGVREGSDFILCDYLLVSILFIEKTLFFSLNCLSNLLKYQLLIKYGFISGQSVSLSAHLLIYLFIYPSIHLWSL